MLLYEFEGRGFCIEFMDNTVMMGYCLKTLKSWAGGSGELPPSWIWIGKVGR